jgi:hypothetical protein
LTAARATGKGKGKQGKRQRAKGKRQNQERASGGHCHHSFISLPCLRRSSFCLLHFAFCLFFLLSCLRVGMWQLRRKANSPLGSEDLSTALNPAASKTVFHVRRTNAHSRHRLREKR